MWIKLVNFFKMVKILNTTASLSYIYLQVSFLNAWLNYLNALNGKTKQQKVMNVYLMGWQGIKVKRSTHIHKNDIGA